MPRSVLFFFFFFNDTATTEIYTLSLHDALPIYITRALREQLKLLERLSNMNLTNPSRSEEHTSELQSLTNLVCRLLLEKKKKHHARPRTRDASVRMNCDIEPALTSDLLLSLDAA